MSVMYCGSHMKFQITHFLQFSVEFSFRAADGVGATHDVIPRWHVGRQCPLEPETYFPGALSFTAVWPWLIGKRDTTRELNKSQNDVKINNNKPMRHHFCFLLLAAREWKRKRVPLALKKMVTNIDQKMVATHLGIIRIIKHLTNSWAVCLEATAATGGHYPFVFCSRLMSHERAKQATD